MSTHLVRLNPKKILYRNFKNFNEQSFLTDVENTNFNCDGEDPNRNYDNLVDTFIEIVDKHAPLKTKFLRGNEAPFMNKELRKAIYTRSRLKNKWNKNPTFENRAKYKKQRNKCVSLRKKAIKTHFRQVHARTNLIHFLVKLLRVGSDSLKYFKYFKRWGNLNFPFENP